MKQHTIPNWFPLDVAATIYPFSRTRTWSNTYRFAFLLREEIDPVLLRQAVADTYPRFPSFFVNVRCGLFWYYLERRENTDIVSPEEEYPCRGHALFDRARPAIRVLYYKRRVAIEVFHGIADGSATLAVFQALVARYLELTGIAVDYPDQLLNVQDAPKLAELEDCYKKEYTKQAGKAAGGKASYQYKAKKQPNYFKVLHGLIPIEDMKALAKSRGLTITDYLLAVFLHAFYVTAPRQKKPIIISVPVGLREMYHSETLRNFSLFSNIGFDPTLKEHFSFDDIAQAIKGRLDQGKSKEEIHKMLCQNVKMADSMLLRLVPLPLKRGLLKLSIKLAGETKFVTTMSNLGVVNLPEAMQQQIERAEVLLGEKPGKRIGCTLLSYNGMMNITMTGNTKQVEVQRAFFRLLAEHGARVRIECNDNTTGGLAV